MTVSRQGKMLIGIIVSLQERHQISKLAKARGFKFTSDYLRHLIETDGQASGMPLTLTLAEEGNRPRATEQEGTTTQFQEGDRVQITRETDAWTEVGRLGHITAVSRKGYTVKLDNNATLFRLDDDDLELAAGYRPPR
jgi:hypothetical protein